MLLRARKQEYTADPIEIIERCESFLIHCDKQNIKGAEQYPSGIYDSVKYRLQELCPQSEVLKGVAVEEAENEEITGYDKYLVQNPITPLITVKAVQSEEVNTFKSKMPTGKVRLLCSLKGQGQGVRIVYNKGRLIRATTIEGKDVLRQMQIIMGAEKEEFKKYVLIELRGEVFLPNKNVLQARRYTGGVQVRDIMREGATEAEVQLLAFRGNDVYIEGQEQARWSDKYNWIEEQGIATPASIIVTVEQDTIEASLKRIVEIMYEKFIDESQGHGGYEENTEGVVVQVDNIEQSKGVHGLLLKTGFWEQNLYNGEIERIEWVQGTSKIKPVAVLKDEVQTLSGKGVKYVPIPNPKVMIEIEAYPENAVWFREGEGAEIIVCDKAGVPKQ